MSDFSDALSRKLSRNEEVQREQAAAREAEAEREREQREQEERRAQEQQEQREQRHAELVEHVEALVDELERSAPESFIARLGWSQSGEEFLAKISTVQLRPRRTLSLDLDRDDDQILARWHSDLGDSLEMWRILEVTPELLTELVLQVVDQDLWTGRSTPPTFPR